MKEKVITPKHTFGTLEKLIIFLSYILLHSSCVTYKDFSKVYQIPKPIDFSDPKVQKSFELEKVYRITIRSNRELDLYVKEIGITGLKGILINSQAYQKDELSQLFEVPYNFIQKARKKEPDPSATSAVIGITVGVFLILFVYLMSTMTFTIN